MDAIQAAWTPERAMRSAWLLSWQRSGRPPCWLYLTNDPKLTDFESWYHTGTDADEDREEMDAIQAAWTPEKRNAERLVAELAEKWEAPMLAMSRAGRAFAGLEAVLGGDAFSLQVPYLRILSLQQSVSRYVQHCALPRRHAKASCWPCYALGALLLAWKLSLEGTPSACRCIADVDCIN